jgi:hypothetical protein
LRQLREILANQAQNQLLLFDLDFVDLADDLLIDLFYDPKRQKKQLVDANNNIMLPPRAQRRTSTEIINWFVELGKKDKREVLDKYENYIIDTRGRINYTQSRHCQSLPEPEPEPKPEQIPSL